MPALPAGEYQASVSLYDPDLDRRINLLDGRSADKQQIQNEIALGKLKITAPSTAGKTMTK